MSAIVLPGFGAPAWVLRALMIVLALGLGATLLAVWGRDRRAAGRPILPRAPHGRVAWVLTALLPAALVTAFFLWHPLDHPVAQPTATVPNADPSAPEKSLAVLPFANLSSDKENAFFADGVQDEVLTDLAKVADLKVISRTSVMQYKRHWQPQPARDRQSAGGRFRRGRQRAARGQQNPRRSAQLIDARTDGHKWAEHYDRDLADVFAIQSEIAQAIVTGNSRPPSPHRPTPR